MQLQCYVTVSSKTKNILLNNDNNSYIMHGYFMQWQNALGANNIEQETIMIL